MKFKSSGKKKNCRITWQGGYKLTSYDKGRFLLLDGQEKVVPISEISKNHDTLILGEPGAGVATFMKWLKKGLEKPFAIVKGDWTTNEDITFSSDVDKSRKEAFKRTLKKLDQSNISEEFTQWILSLKSCCHLIFTKISPERTKKLAESMRSLRERDNKDFKNLKVIIHSSSEDAFLEHAFNSAYIDFCHTYKLPRFLSEEVKEILEGYIENLNLHAEAQALIMEYTGGQPSLVHLLAQEISAYAEPQVDPTLVQLAFDEVKSNGCHVLEEWEHMLQEHLKAHPDSRDILARYMRENLQKDRLPPPVKDRGLYVAGWLGLNEQGSWGITSAFHRHIAAKVLARG